MTESTQPTDPEYLILKTQPRHTACDRCRSQKLRCQSDATQGMDPLPCHRCQRAGSKCVYSGRVRTIKMATPNSTKKPRREHHSAPTSIQHFPISAHEPENARERTHKAEHRGESMPTAEEKTALDVIFADEHHFDYLDYASNTQGDPEAMELSTTMGLSFLPVSDMLQNGFSETMNQDSAASHIDPEYSIVPPSFAHYEGNTFEFHSTLGYDALLKQSSSVSVSPLENDELMSDSSDTAPHHVDGEATRQSPETSGTDTWRSDSETAVHSAAEHGYMGKTITYGAKREDATPVQFLQSHAQAQCVSQTNSISLESLFRLNMKLHGLTMEMTKAVPVPASEDTFCQTLPYPKYIDQIASMSELFLDILHGFTSSESPPGNELDIFDSVSEEMELEDLPSNSKESQCSPLPEMNGITADAADPRRMGVTSASQAPRALPDIHAILQAVSCYTRLMRLYSNLIMFMQDGVNAGVLRTPAASSWIPTLKIGTVQVQGSTSLQLLLLLQVTEHMVERITAAIMGVMNVTGLGDGAITCANHCPGGVAEAKQSTQCRHFLGSAKGCVRGNHVSVERVSRYKQILDVAIQQEDLEGSITGCRSIHSLREDLNRLVKSLKEPMFS